VATLSLDRADRLNAMIVPMVAEIRDALDRIDADDRVRAQSSRLRDRMGHLSLVVQEPRRGA
jgi:hypothetical protein